MKKNFKSSLSNKILNISDLKLSLDYSHSFFPKNFINKKRKELKRVWNLMMNLEKGSIANYTENKMVGHYWLRNSSLSPNIFIKKKIDKNLSRIKKFKKLIKNGINLWGQKIFFKNFVFIGVGGSSLCLQFISNLFKKDIYKKKKVLFLDNADLESIFIIFKQKLKNQLRKTLVLFISKSGETLEINSSLLVIKEIYIKLGLNFSHYFIAITQRFSKLEKIAKKEKWIKTFPIWDWVGGRTSIFSSAGLVPLSLQGIDINKMIHGAKIMDHYTRNDDFDMNPAMILALIWYFLKYYSKKNNMVIIPYRDSFEFFVRYIQQIVMESIGKSGKIKKEGITVYGNKGSSDQHSYIQQLMDGPNNFFVTFIEVLKDDSFTERFFLNKEFGKVTLGECLNSLYLGAKESLFKKSRSSITITISEISPESIGGIIALYERAVGYYGFLTGVNAYDQPGVEGGKIMVKKILTLKNKIINYIESNPNREFSISFLVKKLEIINDYYLVFKILEYQSLNSKLSMIFKTKVNKSILENRYKYVTN
jgi:glucose-6-phosphate isomerase